MNKEERGTGKEVEEGKSGEQDLRGGKLTIYLKIEELKLIAFASYFVLI